VYIFGKIELWQPKVGKNISTKQVIFGKKIKFPVSQIKQHKTSITNFCNKLVSINIYICPFKCHNLTKAQFHPKE